MRLAAVLAAALFVVPAVQRPPAAPPFFFLQFSDPQFGMFTADKDFAQETINFESAVATANRLRPAFVVITGDLVNKPGDLAQIAEYRRIAAKLDPSIPLHHMPGNHDVTNTPTPDTIAAYVKIFGPDHFVFRHDTFTGIVLNSTLLAAPDNAPALAGAQLAWLRGELAAARRSGAQHVVVFQHHPWFLVAATEPDAYFNVPRAKRDIYLPLFHEFGVKYLFCGHYHRNALARDAEIELVTTGPVGKPLGGAVSGLRVVIVRDGGLEHQYYPLDSVPARIDLQTLRPIHHSSFTIHH